MHLSKPLTVCISFFIHATAAPSSDPASFGDVAQFRILERGNTPPAKLSHRVNVLRYSKPLPPVNQLSSPSKASTSPDDDFPPPADPFSPPSDSWAAVPNPLSSAQAVFKNPHAADPSTPKRASPLAERGAVNSCFQPGGCQPGKGTHKGTPKDLPSLPIYFYLQCRSADQEDCDQICRCNDAGQISCDKLSKNQQSDLRYRLLSFKTRACYRRCQCVNDPSRDPYFRPASAHRASSLPATVEFTSPNRASTPQVVKRGAMQSCSKHSEKCKSDTASPASSPSGQLDYGDSTPPGRRLSSARSAPWGPFLSSFDSKHVTSRGRRIQCTGANKNYCKRNCYCAGPGNMVCDKQRESEIERLMQTPSHFLRWRAEEAADKGIEKIFAECEKSCRCLEKPV